MARVTYGGGVTEFAGSIGGVTFLRNASGPIAKLRSRPIVNPSPIQSLRQTFLAILVAHWSTLSQANKDAWDALAAAHDHTTPWGETKTLSGYQWFIGCNIMRSHTIGSILNTPYAWFAASPPDQFTIEVAAGYIRVAWSPNYDAAEDLVAYVTLPLRQSSLKLRRSLFHIANYPDAPSLANWDLTTEIEVLYNVDWATFFASADCSIIIRIRQGWFNFGLFSSFTSAIIKID